MGWFSRGISAGAETGASLYADKAKRDMLTDAARELRDEQWVKNAELLKDQNILDEANKLEKWNHEDDLLVHKEEIAERAANKLATANANLYKIKKETTHRLDTQYGGYETLLKEQTAVKNTVDLVLGEDYETSTENNLTEPERVEVKRDLHAAIESRNRSLRSNGYNVPLIEVGRLLLAGQPVPKIPAEELEGIYKYTSAELAKINAKLAAATPAAAATPTPAPTPAAAAAAYTPPSLKERGGEVGHWMNNRWYSDKDWNATIAADESELVENLARGVDPSRWHEFRDKGQQPTPATAPKPTKVSRTAEQESTAGKSNRSAYTAKQADVDRKRWMSFYQRNSGIPYNPLGLNSLFKPKKK
jgi:hypothetical protein